MKIRKLLVIIWLTIIFTTIGSLFWYNELVYSLPTPVPKNYHPLRSGEQIDLKGKLSFNFKKPVFIHFFNPDCPCSRFNIPHFNSLVRKYGDKVDFEIVVLSKDKKYSQDEIQDKFDLKIPISFDTAIGNICGVYSTPQAVIIDKNHSLYYRGNYNKSRYCTDNRSYFAQIALDSLLDNQLTPLFDQIATISYGCKIPMCKN